MSSFDPSAWPRKVNLGCGFDRRVGYLNVDLHEFHGPDLVGDVRDLPELPTAAYEEILAIDVLEHLRRDDATVALREWARLLAIGGKLVLRVPNLLGLARLLCDARTDVQQQRVLVQCLFGTQAYDGDFHQNGFTELLLREELRLAGFDCLRVEPRDEWLFDVVAVRVTEPAEVTIESCRFMDLRLPSEVLAAVLTPAAGEPSSDGSPAPPNRLEHAAWGGRVRKASARLRRASGRLRRWTAARSPFNR